jgi:glutathione S-transferase
MLTIHHLEKSQSERIVWLCEELDTPYELRRYERDPLTRLAPIEYRALTPFGTAPVITDGALTLGESAAIVENVARVHGQGRLLARPDAPDYADFLFWFHFSNGSLMPAAMIDSVARRLGGDNPLVTALRSRHHRAHALLEQRLAGVPFLAGDTFTAADVMTLFVLTTMRFFSSHDLSPYPHIRAYVERMTARPAYVRAMRRAEPDAKAPA